MKKYAYVVAAGLLLTSTLQSATAMEHHHKPHAVFAQQSHPRPFADAYAALQPWQPRVRSRSHSYYSGEYLGPPPDIRQIMH